VVDQDAMLKTERASPPCLPLEVRRRSFAEVELALTVEQARQEARRCLRCDLEFTQPATPAVAAHVTVGEEAR
jgi:hypothetical protein